MCHAFLQSNAQSLAMDPMGAVAGIASAVIGAITLGVGTLVGAVVQWVFEDTVTPIAVAFLCSGLVAALLSAGPSRTGGAPTPSTRATGSRSRGSPWVADPAGRRLASNGGGRPRVACGRDRRGIRHACPGGD
jgi:hypothetical protein